MLERDCYRFMDPSALKPTEGIEYRADETYIARELDRRFPSEVFPSVKVRHFQNGIYGKKPNLTEKLWGARTLIDGLPDFYEIELIHATGEHAEQLIVWTPVCWNDRFFGTGGGGTGIGGRGYLTYPENTSRGCTVPLALVNGFSAATMNAENQKGLRDLTLRKDGSLDWEIYENWCWRSTHNMTRFGKAVTEILHDRKIRYSYMNGASGGGRQTLTELQGFPDEYDGAWASCPAINWHQFLLGGFWPLAVMKKYSTFISPEKNEFFLNAVIEKYGGAGAFYHMEHPAVFDAGELIGQSCGRGVITEADACVMNEIWAGPHRENGERLWYGYYPGCRNWNVGIPIGTYYYPFLSRNKVRPFIIAEYYARWILEDRSFTYRDIDQRMLCELYDRGAAKFPGCFSNNPEIDQFVNHGGKLIMDHGMDDPLIPTEGTIDYYRRLQNHFGKEKLDEFCRMYITPGDNHGNCWGNGPGLTASAGMNALVNWVENGIAPEEIRKVRIDRKTQATIEEGQQKPYGRQEI